MLNDMINCAFQLVGAALFSTNIRAILREKTLEGIRWQPQAFFSAWGFWNLWYYPSLDQWFSFAGGAILVAVNVTWVVLAVYYSSDCDCLTMTPDGGCHSRPGRCTMSGDDE